MRGGGRDIDVPADSRFRRTARFRRTGGQGSRSGGPDRPPTEGIAAILSCSGTALARFDLDFSAYTFASEKLENTAVRLARQIACMARGDPRWSKERTPLLA